MSAQPPSAVELEFARRYDQEHARVCLQPRPRGLAARLSQWRGEQLMRHALKVAGEPGLVLDVACGAGSFWPVLAEHGNRVILAADQSQDMLNHAQTHHPAALLKRVKTFQSSAFSIGLSENAVDCIFCMRLFQHVDSSEHRLAMLQEFHRVSRDTVIVSVRLERSIKVGPRLEADNLSFVGAQAPRATSKSQVEAEFREAGFEVLNHRDFVPGFALTRVYVLRKTS
ncbi:class I SAM-dependent methyltransferase [Pseudomonas purpurea]|uniref:class I SAM-dependent methyltransferase n=1 Tax=Pseudomonas purpurea TaxID=3136737 RepID=UPI003262FC1C